MIRISGGEFRGRQIESPKQSAAVRPTTSMMRESLFSSLQQVIPGCRFMDLFAGSGLMGIEALSRGAVFVLAVESHREHLKLIQNNYAKLGIEIEQAKAIQMDVLALMAKTNLHEPFDVVFLDPPYGFADLQTLVAHIEANGWLVEGGWLIVEHGAREPELQGFTRKQFGDSAMSIKQC